MHKFVYRLHLHINFKDNVAFFSILLLLDCNKNLEYPTMYQSDKVTQDRSSSSHLELKIKRIENYPTSNMSMPNCSYG